MGFAKRNGLTVTGTHGNRLLLDVNGSVADIQQAFHVTMRVIGNPTESRDFYAPDIEPSMDARSSDCRHQRIEQLCLAAPEEPDSECIIRRSFRSAQIRFRLRRRLPWQRFSRRLSSRESH